MYKIFMYIYSVFLLIKEYFKNFFVKNEETNISSFDKVFNFVTRHSLVIGIGTLAFYAIIPTEEEYRTLRLIALFWSFANLLAGTGVYTFTSMNYTKALLRGEDNKYSVYERVAMIRMLGDIYKATLALVGLSIFAVYLAQFAKG